MNTMHFDPRKRYHFSQKTEWEIQDIQGTIINTNHKPKGIWYCFGKEWFEWDLKNISDGESRYTAAFQLELHMDRILQVETTHEEISKLASRYTIEIHRDFPIIDWDAVRKEYAGVEFNPYHHWPLPLVSSAEPDLHFFSMINLWTLISTLDIASGCIWSPDAIKSVSPPIFL